MKSSNKLISILLILLSMSLISCSEDDDDDNDGGNVDFGAVTMSADISGAMNLDFESEFSTFTLLETNGIATMNLTGNDIVDQTTHSITVSISDVPFVGETVLITFISADASSNSVNYEITDLETEITKNDDTTVEGTFSFTATKFDTQEVYTVSNGVFSGDKSKAVTN